MNSLSVMLTKAQRKEAEALDQLAADVRQAYEHHMQARGSGLLYAVEVGNLLRRAKHALQHGQFKPWIEAQKFPFQYAWANVCMQASEAYGYLIDKQISTQVDICNGYESVRDLAAARHLAKEGKDPLTVQHVPRPKVKKSTVSSEEAEAAYREDVATAASKVVSENEGKLLARIAELESNTQALGMESRIIELEAENAALKAEVQRLNEVRAAMVLEIEAVKAEYRALREVAMNSKGPIDSCVFNGLAADPLTSEERTFIAEVKAEHAARKKKAASNTVTRKGAHVVERDADGKIVSQAIDLGHIISNTEKPKRTPAERKPRK